MNQRGHVARTRHHVQCICSMLWWKKHLKKGNLIFRWFELFVHVVNFTYRKKMSRESLQVTIGKPPLFYHSKRRGVVGVAFIGRILISVVQILIMDLNTKPRYVCMYTANSTSLFQIFLHNYNNQFSLKWPFQNGLKLPVLLNLCKLYLRFQLYVNIMLA